MMLARHAHANHSVASRSHSIHFMRSTLASKRAANASFPPRMPRMHAAASTDAQVEDNEKDNTAVHTTESSKEVDINPSVYDDMMDGQSEDYQIDWRKKWYAVHPIDQLPEDRPWGFRVLGKALVAWKDGEGQWRVFEDACPHRRVPLSEGRKEEDGTLSCAYHGWRFDGEGQCQTIPQLEEEFIDKEKPLPKAACATSFPVAEASGLLFVFMIPGADGLLESLKVPVPEALELGETPDDPKQARMLGPWFSREVPMSFEVLFENLTDPSHVSFAHHGITPFMKRDKPSIYPYDKVEEDPELTGYLVGASKFGYAMKGFSRILSRNVMDQRHFPSMSQHWVYKLEEGQDPEKPVENLLEGDAFMCQTFYFIPVTATSSRFITRGDGHVEKVAKWILGDLQPTFMSHLMSIALTDGDMTLLNRQSGDIYNKQLSYKDYYMPARSDRGVLALWKHLAKHSKEGINYYPHTPVTSYLPPEQALERYNSHVKDCKECRQALQFTKVATWTFGAVALLATLAISMGLTRGDVPIRGLVSSGIVGAVSAFISSKLHEFQKNFYFVPYVHQDKN